MSLELSSYLKLSQNKMPKILYLDFIEIKPTVIPAAH